MILMDGNSQVSSDKINGSFFKKNVFQEIDIVQDKIDGINATFKDIIEKLSPYIDDKKSKSGGVCLKLEHTDRDGYYITTTLKRSETLKKSLKSRNYPKFKLSLRDYLFETETIETKTASKPNVKILNPLLKDLSEN